MADTCTLVVVCCHAIFHGSDPVQESHWALQPFQRSSHAKPGEHLTFLQHIDIALALQSGSGRGRDRPTVAFSGGATNLDHPNLTESQGYFNAAVASERYGDMNGVILEELATDTYQNLLFSILKYRAVKGSYPHSIIVVTHNFKFERVDLHRKALRWNRPFTILGHNPPFSASELAQVQHLELTNAYEPFQHDPYGVRPPLSSKRLTRGWDEAQLRNILDWDGAASGQNSADEVVERLLSWKGGESGDELFPERLPWEDSGE